MNVAIEKHLATILENKFIELFNEIASGNASNDGAKTTVLGMYTYIRMMIDQETTTVPVIIDKLIEKFNIENDFVLFVLKKLEASGALMIVKNKEN